MIEIHDESSIRAILRDPTFVPIDVAGTLSVLATATQCDFSSLSSRTSAIPFFAMGSRHRDLRLHLSGFFRPDILEPWRPTISVKAARLVAALSRKNGACLVDDFSFPLLLELAFDMLGIRPLERDIGLGFFHDLEALMEPLPSLAQIVRAQSALEQLSNHVLAFEPQQLTNGLKTLTEQLTKEQTVSNALTPTDIGTVVAICFMTTLATANMLSNILGDLLEAPEGLEQIAQRDLVKPNVDDMLRTSTVVTLILRRTTVGQKVGKHTLNAGDLVSLMIGDVNRDQSRCPANKGPNTQQQRQLIFGAGLHTCPASHMARMIIEEALIAIGQGLGDATITVPATRVTRRRVRFTKNLFITWPKGRQST